MFYIQGAYFFLTGLWPIVSITTFQLITGPKRDIWLVKTVGTLAMAISLGLITAGLRGGMPSVDIIIVAISSALAFMLIDIIYVFRRIIPGIYLFDAIAEFIFIAAWLAAILT